MHSKHQALYRYQLTSPTVSKQSGKSIKKWEGWWTIRKIFYPTHWWLLLRQSSRLPYLSTWEYNKPFRCSFSGLLHWFWFPVDCIEKVLNYWNYRVKWRYGDAKTSSTQTKWPRQYPSHVQFVYKISRWKPLFHGHRIMSLHVGCIC